MFADSMLETSWSQRSRRGWMTLTSFGVQAVVMVLLMMLPLLRPEGLPLLRRLSTPISMGRPMPEPEPMQMVATGHPTILQSNLLNGRVMTPQRIPNGIPQIADDPSAAPAGPSGPYVPGGTGDPNGVLDSISGTRPVVPAPPTARPPVRQPPISHMMEGNLIQRVQPTYPQIARSARIQGQVLLSALISKQGTIENLRVLAGHPMLVRAAEEAVSQWRYRPYVLNGEPVEVETRITVNFSLSGN